MKKIRFSEFDAAILYCFIFLYFVFAGPGAFSLDGLRRKAPNAS